MNIVPAAQAVDMRRGVDYIGVTCCFWCHDGRGAVLLHKRSNKCRDEIGVWDCGGGSMEFGETFEQAVLREIREEYCVTPEELVFCGVDNVLRDNSGIPSHWVAIVFAARVNPENVRIGEPDKMDEIGWFTADNLPRPLHTMTLKHLGVVRAAGINI